MKITKEFDKKLVEIVLDMVIHDVNTSTYHLTYPNEHNFIPGKSGINTCGVYSPTHFNIEIKIERLERKSKYKSEKEDMLDTKNYSIEEKSMNYLKSLKKLRKEQKISEYLKENLETVSSQDIENVLKFKNHMKQKNDDTKNYSNNTIVEFDSL